MAFIGSVVWSHAYWGYFLNRPNIFSDHSHLRFSAASFVQLDAESGSVSDVSSDRSSDCPPEWDSDMPTCVLVRLVANGPGGPPAATVDRQVLARVAEDVMGSGLVVSGEAGYFRARELHGVVAVGRDDGGRDLVLAYFTGGEVSNDHHPAYQFVFSSAGDGELTTIDQAWHFFDVAGIEGVEWPAVFVVMLAPAGGFVTVVWAAADLRASRKRRLRHPT